MRWTLLGVSALCLACWIFFGAYAGPLGLPVPALGPFLHPTTGFWRSAQPEYVEAPAGELRLSDPLSEGEVHFDERNIPHVFAASAERAVFLQAYVTARDRLWQMDISTRSTGGRLAEVLGERLVDRDRSQIRNGYRAAARHLVETWKTHFPDDYRLLEIYAAGVNAYVEGLRPEDYPVEFKLLDYAPEAWTPYHSALMLKGMTQSMTDRNNDGEHQSARERLGLEAYRDLYPFWNADNPPIMPPPYPKAKNADAPKARSLADEPLALVERASSISTEMTERGRSTHPANELIERWLTDLSERPPGWNWHSDNGSNNWVVAGERSQSKRPILAGDPHLGLTLPSIWYEIQMQCPAGNVRGVSLPGLPLVVIGFNQHVAWSMTNGQEDVVDWHRINWEGGDFEHYRYQGERRAALIHVDTLFRKDGEPEIVRTPWTAFGPVPETVDTSSRYFGLAKNAIALYTPIDRPGAEVTALLGMLSARNYADFKQTMRSYGEPLMNFAFADRHGEISLLTNGFWPIRSVSDSFPTGRFVVSADESAWRGGIPYEQLPENHAPSSGFAASANQHPTGPDYPYAYSGYFMPWRAREINDRLSEQEIHGQRESKELQQDSRSTMAAALTPLLLARIDRQHLSAADRKWFQLLADWDYVFRADSRAATFFERWRRRAYALTVDEIDTKDGFPPLRDWRWIELLRDEPRHEIFDIKDTDGRETAAILTQRAFDEVLEELEEEEFATWAEERDTRIPHLGRIPGFGTEVLIADGHRTAPNAISGGHGPSWRMVVELGERPRAWGVLPGGASGNPASPYYALGVEEWTKGRYYELSLWSDPGEAALKSTSQLVFHHGK